MGLVQLNISSSRGSKFTVDVDANATLADVKRAIHSKTKLHPTRQRLGLALDNTVKLTDGGRLNDALGSRGQLKDGVELKLKDLGPQIDWKTVFVIEYLGPLLIHPLVYHFPELWYGKNFEHSALQKYVYAFVMIHFVKRELETLFVHRFSHSTMPVFNLFKNSFHYHILAGLFLAFDVYRYKYSATSAYIVNTLRDNERFLWISAGIWAFFELSNLHTHLKLRALRPAGSTKRAIPYGYGYNLVSFPNYFFEMMAWVTISLLTCSVAAWLFTAVATGQMLIWALTKHHNYRKQFAKEYPRERKAMIPFVL